MSSALPTLLLRAGRLLLVTALALSIGLHWAALQSVAWVGMLVTYSQQTETWGSAIEQTFDGAHPCELCLAIQDHHQGEGEDPLAKTGKSIDKSLQRHADEAWLLTAPVVARVPVGHAEWQARVRAGCPPHGPPRTKWI